MNLVQILTAENKDLVQILRTRSLPKGPAQYTTEWARILERASALFLQIHGFHPQYLWSWKADKRWRTQNIRARTKVLLISLYVFAHHDIIVPDLHPDFRAYLNGDATQIPKLTAVFQASFCGFRGFVIPANKVHAFVQQSLISLDGRADARAWKCCGLYSKVFHNGDIVFAFNQGARTAEREAWRKSKNKRAHPEAVERPENTSDEDSADERSKKKNREEKESESAETENTETESAEIENAEIESAEIENAEIENAEIENAEIESAESAFSKFRTRNKTEAIALDRAVAALKALSHPSCA